MSVMLPAIDSLPRGGVWADEHPDLSLQEILEGEEAGRVLEDGPRPRSSRIGMLADALRDYGVQVVLMLRPGRPGVPVDRFVGALGHHTAGPWRDSAGRVLWTPSLKICTDGRPGLPGPLCNGYGGRDLVARLITEGGANHPGEGGPITIGGVTIPANNGRPYLFGWEFEHNGTDEPWTDEMIDFSSRCMAATVDVYGGGNPDRATDHKVWARPAGRKTDRAGYSQGRVQREIIVAQGKTAVPPAPRILRLTKPLMQGADVQTLQNRLNGLGLNAGIADGVFGSQTEDAVRRLQERAGVSVDGVYGPQSAEALARLEAQRLDPDSLVVGAIRDKWKGLPQEVSDLLGKPTTEERGTPDGRGRYNHFEGGSIYWTPETGAQVVRGQIRAAWEKIGWEQSFTGYPVEDESPTEHPGYKQQQKFERATLLWTDGVVTAEHEIWRQ